MASDRDIGDRLREAIEHTQDSETRDLHAAALHELEEYRRSAWDSWFGWRMALKKIKRHTEVRAEVEPRKLPAGEALRRLGWNVRGGRKRKVPWKMLLRDYDILTGPDIPPRARTLHFVDELEELPTRIDRAGSEPLEPQEAIERIGKFYGYASDGAARESLFRAVGQAKTALERTPEDRWLRTLIAAVESRFPPR